ncbi:MAG TPA: EamA family transporter [Phototrophicaceae bacterium]|nr:EamA family transporter [Phototrophicaceae bacterium]
MNPNKSPLIPGLLTALSTPLFLGVAPIFGKLAIRAGFDPFTVAALRTIVAVAMLWVFYLLFYRQYIFIYPAGLLGCIVIGVINGIGSLFYYSGLSLLDASLAQLLNGMYLAFAVLLSHLGGQKADGRTLLRVGLATVALVMLAGFGKEAVNWIGVGLMLGSALMFAGTMILSQYVLYEMPSQTVTLYILSTMAVVVTMVWLAAIDMPRATTPLEWQAPHMVQQLAIQMTDAVRLIPFQRGLLPVIILGVTTALSRLAMFTGVKVLGSMQTAILAILEIGVALVLAFIFLDDRLKPIQVMGGGVLLLSLLLIRQKDLLPHGYNPSALVVANMASVQFQRIAFHRAFGTKELDNEAGTMSNVTTQEILAIQRMMGAQLGGIDPFPIGKTNQQ